MNTSDPVEIFENRPLDFAPQVEASACYLEIGGKILLLQNALHKSESTKWGVPAGKLELNETPEAAAIRELWEETGIQAPVCFVSTLYIRKPELDYVYHMFYVHLDEMPSVLLSDEHLQYVWSSQDEMKELSLMLGAKEALTTYYGWKERLC